MISFSGVTMSFGTQVVFQGVDWQLHPGRKYGLVGANGTGKSTILKLMSGELRPEAGEISRPKELRLGVLGQDHFQYDQDTLLHVVLRGKPKLWAALEEKEKLIAKVTAPGHEMTPEEGHRLGDLEVAIADADGYVAEGVAAALLEGLGLPTDRHDKKMSELSGGYRLRVMLAQTLFQEPELLLLDEPTNHLDIVSIRWLENYLRDFPGTLVLVSHDRHFLNAIADYIADVDYQELRIYTGNYDKFVAAKELGDEQKLKEIARAEKKTAELQQFIDRFKAKATKARQAGSRQKQLDRIEMPDIKRSSRRYPTFRFAPKINSGRDALAVREISKSFNGNQVLNNVGFEIRRGEKVAIVGQNGIGKSTLLNIIVGQLEQDQGEVSPGHEVRIGYFAQDLTEMQTSRGSIYEWLYSIAPHEDISTIRGTLGRVLFSGDEADKKLRSLSGGEATRLRLASLMLRGDNLMILDEPTNHLDLESREALMDGLHAYEGTLIFVSHDRHFVSHVATRVLALSPEGLEDFSGTYDEYLDRQGADYLNADIAAQKTGKDEDNTPSQQSLSYEERKERKREASRMRRKVSDLEKQVAKLEQQIEEQAKRFTEPAYYQETPRDKQQAEERAHQENQSTLQSTIEEWEEAAAELESYTE